MVSGMDRGWLWEVEGLFRLRKGSGWWRQHVWRSPFPSLLLIMSHGALVLSLLGERTGR